MHSVDRRALVLRKQALVHARDPIAFGRDLAPFVLDEYQERALAWDGRRLLLNCTRQWGKSTIIALRALRRAIFVPMTLILLVSPTLRQSLELFAKVAFFRKRVRYLAPPLEDNKLSCTLANGSRIVALPGNPEGIRGYSAPGLIVLDEDAFIPDAMMAAVRPMLISSGGQLIEMSSPFGKRGHFYESWANGGDAYDRIEVNAFQVPRFDRAMLEEERRALGDWLFRQEYMCEFVDTIDSVFTHEQVMGALANDVEAMFTDLLEAA